MFLHGIHTMGAFHPFHIDCNVSHVQIHSHMENGFRFLTYRSAVASHEYVRYAVAIYALNAKCYDSWKTKNNTYSGKWRIGFHANHTVKQCVPYYADRPTNKL